MAKRGKIQRRERVKTKEFIQRPTRLRRYEYLFLIVCEDEKTEPFYFQQFQQLLPEKTLHLEVIGTGRDPKGVVEQAIIKRSELAIEKEADAIWIVFDKDDADENDTKISKFNMAFDIAKREKFKIAYSNEVFELWLLLHFVDINPTLALPRKVVYELLENEIQKHDNAFIYEHGKPAIIEKISTFGDENKAMERAKSLVQFHRKRSPISSNPNTKVHLLVKELREWIAFYDWEKR